jgi:hypothetical protein
MYKMVLILLAFCTLVTGNKAQSIKKELLTDTPVNRIDSLLLQESKDNDAGNIPVISLTASDLADKSSQDISSLLTAGHDVFNSSASYNFSIAKFKIRGYDPDLSGTYLNGIPMENLENGFATSGSWGGLNEIMHYRDESIGLRSNTFAFGSAGGAVNIDVRAGRQKKQTQVGYSFSNGNYTHRWSYTHNTGVSKNGWAFTISGSRRWTEEGYIPGSYYKGWSYFAAADKHMGYHHTLSLVIFVAPTEIGKQGTSTAEAFELAGTHYYNPYWGYQNGRKRNACADRTNEPVLIFSHDYRISNHENIITAVSYSFGYKGSGNLDWYNAADPRPDYYQYLPSYYQDDSQMLKQLQDKWKNSESVRQINWANLYDANKSSVEVFNGVTGHRSHYLLQEAVTSLRNFSFSTVLNKSTGKKGEFTAGLSYQYQVNTYYKKILDLLGGDYFVDLDQYAQRDFPLDSNANQNDLNHPDRIVRSGDKYCYNYTIHTDKAALWLQEVVQLRKVDFFFASQVSYTRFWRVGNVKNGLFPNNSFGKSSVNNFKNYAVKTGITYKIDGRNYFYINGGVINKAPYANNTYLSPRTRDSKQNTVTSEQIKTLEGGYILNAPLLELRISGYYTRLDNQLDVKSFYHDEYRNFVNLAISNINQLHFGSELGFEIKALPDVVISGTAAVGRYYYKGHQHIDLTIDNNAVILPSDTAYINNYRVGGTPQEAYNFGISYHSPDYWMISLAINYFNKMWIDINPIRRTYKAVQDVVYPSAARNEILAQQEFDGQYSLNFHGSYSWKLPRRLRIYRKSAAYLVFSAAISNLLNNKNLINGGYEQLRYDFTTQSVDKFPPKYYYAYGINCFLSTAIRF